MRDIVITSGFMEEAFHSTPAGHEYRRPAKWGWLADFMWRLLGNLGALREHLETTRTWRFKGNESNPDILKAIFEAIEIEEVYRNPDNFAIVMGIDDYMRLMKQDRADAPPMGFSFNAGTFGYRGETFGLPVHVVTTLSGVAAIPKVLIEARRAA